jgi:hypothetical protein
MPESYVGGEGEVKGLLRNPRHLTQIGPKGAARGGE